MGLFVFWGWVGVVVVHVCFVCYVAWLALLGVLCSANIGCFFLTELDWLGLCWICLWIGLPAAIWTSRGILRMQWSLSISWLLPEYLFGSYI